MTYDNLKKMISQHPNDSNLKQMARAYEADRSMRSEVNNTLKGNERTEAIKELDSAMAMASRKFDAYVKHKYGH